MGKNINDLSGRKFGRWTVIKFHSIINHYSKFECHCECGVIRIVFGNSLKSGKSKSCGCLQKEEACNLHSKHNMTNSLEYSSWENMKARCFNKKHKSYKRYGGRGITICKRWLGDKGFINFIKDMGLKPTPKHTIERINKNKNYTKSNCIWATYFIQNRNHSRNVYITHKGETRIMTDWVGYNEITYDTLRWRYKKHGYYSEIFSKERKTKNKPY